MKLIKGAYFIESENVKVFPCSYRGFNDDKNIFDPEASGFTEYNFANIYGKQTKLISWADNLLKCIIDGYYFEIKNIAPANLFINNKLYKFAIVLDPIDIVGSYQTKVLKSIYANNVNYLDTKIGNDNTYYFTGMALIDKDADINGAVYFSPCKLDKTNTVVIDWQAYRLTDALGTSNGDGSVRMLGTVKTGEDNESISTVCHAAGENAFAIGNNTTAGGDFSIAGGTESKASHENSVAIGNNVSTSADNQAVFGAYNEENTESALIIGNGISTDKKNILEISKAGDINAAGKLDVAGNISSSNGGLQLTNGFISVDNGYEYQKIFGTATYDSNLTYYEKNAETDEMTEKAVTADTFAGLKNNLYIKVHHLSSLDNNGNLLVDGEAQINKKLTTKEQAEIDGDITGHESLTISGAGKTHALTLGSQANIGDYGSITVYGKDAQETKIKAFSVDNEGAATIAKTLTVGTNKLVIDAKGVSINNKKVTIANPTTINNTLAVNGVATITDNKVKTTINKDLINYNNNFTVTNTGDITAKSLTLADGYKITNAEGEEATIHYGITEDGKITGSELTLKDGYKIAADGNATLKDLIINNATLDGIKIEKGDYSVKDADGARDINNIDALKITKYIENSDSGSEEATQGLHVNGKITTAGDFAIGESDGATTKITQGGTAYFKQGLLVGGKVKGANESDDNVTFRVASFSSEAKQTSYADLKGDLNVKKYNNKAGNLTVDGDTTISGSLTIGNINFNKNNITGITKIQAKTFDAISDIRKKTAIQDYICKKSILDLPIKEFEFIDDETHTKNIGCIAQDLQEICPEIVHEDKDGYLSIEETKLVYLLLQEVKELKKEIKALKGE